MYNHVSCVSPIEISGYGVDVVVVAQSCVLYLRSVELVT